MRVIGRMALVLVLFGLPWAILAGCSRSHLPPVEPATDAAREAEAVRGRDATGDATRDAAGDASMARRASPPARTDPAIVVDGRPVPMAELGPHLREIAGAEVIADTVLSLKLRRELDKRGLTIAEEDVDRERSALVRAIETEAGADADTAERLLGDIREQRGLGPARFPALLERNAMLRRLARARIADAGELITEDDVQRRYDILHGERFSARVITLATQREASELRLRLGDEPTTDAFADLAVIHSTDASGARGGSLEPISPLDPAYESIVRRTLGGLEEGKASGVVALESGFAIFYLDKAIPPSGTPLSEVSEQIRADLESRQERVFMDRIAKELLAEANVTIFDRSLEWSWQTR